MPRSKTSKTPASIGRALLCGLCFVAASLSAPNAAAEEWTVGRAISSLEVVSEGTTAGTYYFQSTSGWGASGCPSAPWAYIYSWEFGSTEILAMAMQARQQGWNVQFLGTCNGSGFFHVRAIWY